MSVRGPARHPADVAKLRVNCGLFAWKKGWSKALFLLASGAFLLPFRAALAAPEERPFLVLESSEIAAVSGRPQTISEASWRALDRTRVAGDALAQLTEADAAMTAAKS